MTLSKVVALAIAQEAWRSAPRECCGFCTRNQIFPSQNLHPQPESHYLIEPRLWLRVPREVAVYHSHPKANAQPSEKDHQEGWEGLIYLVYSLTENRLRAYRHEDRKLRPLTLAIEP